MLTQQAAVASKRKPMVHELTELGLKKRIIKIIKLLEKNTLTMDQPAISQIIDEFGQNPFLILICCLLSLRAKDTVVLPVCNTLFKIAGTPEQLLAISPHELEKILYPLGFFHSKAVTLRSVCAELIERFDGQVPAHERELLSIKGIGRKTAGAVLGYAFNIPSICVDVHVHRIVNRLGLVRTKTPEETEKMLMTLVPKKYWIRVNSLFVMWGQNICTPRSPFCSRCAIAHVCPKIGVAKRR